MGGDSPRDAIFEVQKPCIEHIKPPVGMDLKPLIEHHRRISSYDDFDSDDEEAGMETGRISPCTFLHWSQGCERWDVDRDNAKADFEKIKDDLKRLRPETPDVPTVYQNRPPAPDLKHDVDQGSVLGIEYPTSPSIIYTPPGVDPNYMNAGFHLSYSRMAPQAVKDANKHIHGNTFDAKPTQEVEYYTESEVQEVIEQTPFFGHNVSGPGVHEQMAIKWRKVEYNEAEVAKWDKETKSQDARLAKLTATQERLEPVVAFLKEHQMRLHNAAANSKMKKERQNRIREYISTFARDADVHIGISNSRMQSVQRKYRANEAKIGELQKEIEELCLSVEKKEPKEVYAALQETIIDADEADMRAEVDDMIGHLIDAPQDDDEDDDGYEGYSPVMEEYYRDQSPEAPVGPAIRPETNNFGSPAGDHHHHHHVYLSYSDMGYQTASSFNAAMTLKYMNDFNDHMANSPEHRRLYHLALAGGQHQTESGSDDGSSAPTVIRHSDYQPPEHQDHHHNTPSTSTVLPNQYQYQTPYQQHDLEAPELHRPQPQRLDKGKGVDRTVWPSLYRALEY
ncbi:hypothetical protein F4778DRAFT_797998 [Xylariomycetidae sp. FL2044]|nr:hypothetical protein F4778DRAFT_797998 [Xylariomycetidae sp. FL2044]